MRSLVETVHSGRGSDLVPMSDGGDFEEARIR